MPSYEDRQIVHWVVIHAFHKRLHQKSPGHYSRHPFRKSRKSECAIVSTSIRICIRSIQNSSSSWKNIVKLMMVA